MRTPSRLVLRAITAITRPARGTGIVSTRTGTSSRHSGSPSRTSRASAYAWSSIGRRPVGMKRADDVVDVRRGAGRGAHLGGRPEAVATAVGQPQDQVGEGEVGDDLPVRREQLEHADIRLVEVGVAADQLQQGRHRLSLGRGVGSPSGAWPAVHGDWQDGPHVDGVLESGPVRRDDRADGSPTARPHGRADHDARLGRPGRARRDRLPDPGHLGRRGRLRRPSRGARRRHGSGPRPRPGRVGDRLGVPAQLLRARPGGVHRPRQRGGAAPAGQDPGVGRPGQRLAGARARRPRVRPRPRLGARDRPRCRCAQRARRVTASRAQRAHRRARRARRPGPRGDPGPRSRAGSPTGSHAPR